MSIKNTFKTVSDYKKIIEMYETLIEETEKHTRFCSLPIYNHFLKTCEELENKKKEVETEFKNYLKHNNE